MLLFFFVTSSDRSRWNIQMKTRSERMEKRLTNEVKIEGVGTAKTYGELNVEKLVKRLLRSSLGRQ